MFQLAMNLGGFKIASSTEWEMQNLSSTRSTLLVLLLVQLLLAGHYGSSLSLSSTLTLSLSLPDRVINLSEI